MDVLTLAVGVMLFVVMVLAVIFAIRLWDLVTQASEYFARENERYRRAYEQHRKQ